MIKYPIPNTPHHIIKDFDGQYSILFEVGYTYGFYDIDHLNYYLQFNYGCHPITSEFIEAYFNSPLIEELFKYDTI